MGKLEGISPDRSKDMSFREFVWPSLVFLATLALFKLFSSFNFSIGILFAFMIILIVFAKRTVFLFYMFIMSLPFTGSLWTLRIGFGLNPTYLFFALFFLSFIYNKIRLNDYRLTATTLDTPFFLFLTIAAVSVFQTVHLSSTPSIIRDAVINYPWIRGFIGLIFLLCMFAVYQTSVNIIKDKDLFKKVLFIMILVSVIVSSMGLIGFFTALAGNSKISAISGLFVVWAGNDLRVKSIFDEPLFLGDYILSILPVVFCLVMLKKDYFNRNFLRVALFVLTLSLILTVSRGAWAGFLVSTAAFFLFFWKDDYSNFSAKMIKAFFILLLFFTFFILVNKFILKIDTENFENKIESISDKATSPIISIFDPSKSNFWSTRVRIWSAEYAWRGFINHPVLGVGYSNYAFYSGHKVYEGLFNSAINFPEVNNLILRILAETGLIGFGVFIWVLLRLISVIFISLVNEKDDAKKTLLIGYSLSLLAISVHLFFFSFINLAYLWVMMAMLMALCKTETIDLKHALAIKGSSKKEHRKPSVLSRINFIDTAVIIMIVLAVFITVKFTFFKPDYFHRQTTVIEVNFSSLPLHDLSRLPKGKSSIYMDNNSYIITPKNQKAYCNNPETGLHFVYSFYPHLVPEEDYNCPSIFTFVLDARITDGRLFYPDYIYQLSPGGYFEARVGDVLMQNGKIIKVYSLQDNITGGG